MDIIQHRCPWSLAHRSSLREPRHCSRERVQLAYFHHGPDPILIASNHGGPSHPQWYYNLKAHPECQLGDEKFVATEVTDPDEYERLYGLAEQVYAGYGDYRVKTAAIGHQIPVFRLKPVCGAEGFAIKSAIQH